jgi:hypothetical protein
MVTESVNNTTDLESNPQREYFERQITKERTSPQTSLVTILTHLQKEATTVLRDDSINTHEKLARYNKLMAHSAILSKKLRGKRLPVQGQPIYRNQPAPRPDSPLSQSSSIYEDVDSDIDTEGSLTGAVGGYTEGKVEELPEAFRLPKPTLKTPQRPITDKQGSVILSPRAIGWMNAEIQKKIPVSYRANAKKLYPLIAERGKGVLNWSGTGEVRIGGTRIPGSNIIDLLGEITKPPAQGKRKTPTGYLEFLKAVKTINPELLYIRNKPKTTRDTSVTPKKREREQKGSGHRKANRNYGWKNLKWATHL